jgi:hypothetical protein
MATKHFVAVPGSVILLLGIIIGSVLVAARPTFAQSTTEQVTPNMSTATALFNTALAHRVVADQVIVGDHDLGKLLEGLMNLMATTPPTFGGPVYSRDQLKAVIDASAVTPIRVAPQPAARLLSPPSPRKSDVDSD